LAFYLNPNDSSSYVYNVAKGTTYRITVASCYLFNSGYCDHNNLFTGVQQDVFTLAWNMGPVNDYFSHPSTITGFNGALTATNAAATTEPGEPAIDGEPGGASLWYTWTAPADGVVTFDTRGSQVQELLAIYTGPAVTVLQQVGDGKFTAGGTRVQLSAKAGQAYYITIDGFQGKTGVLALNWEPPPANDNFASAAPLTGSSGSVTGTTLGATHESGEPLHAGSTGVGSVWYTWTAPDNSAYSFDVRSSNFVAVLAIYTGSSIDKLTPVASTLSSGIVTFRAHPGTVYRIAVDGQDNSSCSPCRPNTGQVVLTWQPLSALR
jgi:hypothetical protein